MAEADVSGGQFGYWRVAGNAGGEIFGAPVTLAVSHNDNGSSTLGSGYHGTIVGGSFLARFSPDLTLELTGRYGSNYTQSFPDSSGAPCWPSSVMSTDGILGKGRRRSTRRALERSVVSIAPVRLV